MNDIDVSALDLNLLKVLHALLAEGSVTGAARRLGVGQPAASHGLRRLRELFDDPLFVRSGRSIAPTPRAEALREPVARLLGDAARIVRQELVFEPSTTRREFRLICPDLLAPMVGELAATLAVEAPHAALTVTTRRPADARELERGEADVALTPTPSSGPGLVRLGLGRVRFGVVLRAAHPVLGRRRRLSTKAWLGESHVVVRTGHGGESVVGSALARESLERRIGLVVPGFLAALVAVSRTDMLFVAPRSLVQPLLEPLGLRLLPLPIDLAPVPVAAVWHERFGGDPAHRFFRQLVRREVRAGLSE